MGLNLSRKCKKCGINCFPIGKYCPTCYTQEIKKISRTRLRLGTARIRSPIKARPNENL